ncbi:GCN5 family acetyltransferase [Bacillus sp. LL01]|uniref:GNAT family N-acetyltransferase n=1 Tax=Bacillus sp. LL01 TaxID=1665556 RepID=UPI00064D5662|nr:GNAT family N-acetyltransferase [Bacillus sp. LL01]KMJ59956.1 GCN5 family acetyltransferase [Bacillus sp. LL01]
MVVNLTLVKPTTSLETAYLSFYQEWKESKEPMVPWVISKDPSSFEEMVKERLNSEKGIGLPEGWIPDSTFWLLREEDQMILGVVNIRHQLTKTLMNAGGHIGYGIRPSERKKGYATKLLALSIEKTRELGVKDILVVCNEINEASRKTIMNNGGQKDKDFIEEDGNVVQRFWIRQHA